MYNNVGNKEIHHKKIEPFPIYGFAVFILGVLSFAALVSFAEFMTHRPGLSNFKADDAEKIANSIAQKMGYQPKIVPIKEAGFNYHLQSYDALRYDLTGHFPINRYRTFDPTSGCYVRNSPFKSSSDYVIPKGYVDPSKQKLAEKFNKQYSDAVYIKKHYPGNPQVMKNCKNALIGIGIFAAVVIVGTILYWVYRCYSSSSGKSVRNDNTKLVKDSITEGQNTQIEGEIEGKRRIDFLK